jgi:hypothetical protein
MTSAGVSFTPLKRTLKVFCQHCPKPCMGETGWRPSTFRLMAPLGTVSTFILDVGGAQALSRGSEIGVFGDDIVMGHL